MTSPVPRCPDCRNDLGPGTHPACPHCRLPLTGPDAATLWQVDVALGVVEQQRSALLAQREGLLARLRALRDSGGAAAAPAGVQAGVPVAAASPYGWRPAGPARPEVSRRSAQTVLLVLGGLLVSVAALVFTVVSWGYLGIGGRAAVLLALTAVALAVPTVLLRRGLGATAEAAAGVGLGLVLLDAYAARAAGLGGLDGGDAAGYWTVVTALLAGGALGYGWVLRLRFPLVVGFLMTRVPVLLALVWARVEAFQGYATAVVAGTAVDVLLLGAARGAVGGPSLMPEPMPVPVWTGAAAGAGGGAVGGSAGAEVGAGGGSAGSAPGAAAGAGGGVPGGPVGVVAAVRDAWAGLWRVAAGFALLWALVGGLIAAGGSAAAGGVGEAAWAVLPLGALALLALALAWREAELPGAARAMAAGLAGVAIVLALGGVVRQLVDVEWTAVGYEVPALVLLGAVAAGGRTAGVAVRPGAAERSAGTGGAEGAPKAPDAAGAKGMPSGGRARRRGVLAGLGAAAGGMVLLSTLAALPDLLQAVGEPLAHASAAWSDGPDPVWTWELGAAPLVGLVLCGIALLLAARSRVVRFAAGPVEAGAAVAAVVTVALVPVAAGAPYGVAVAVPLVLAVAAVAATVLRGSRPGVLAALGAAPALALMWASADRAATVGTLGVCAVLAVVAAAVLARRGTDVDGVLAPVAGAVGVLLVGGEAAAVGTVLGLADPGVPLAVLAVALATAPLAAALMPRQTDGDAVTSRTRPGGAGPAAGPAAGSDGAGRSSSGAGAGGGFAGPGRGAGASDGAADGRRGEVGPTAAQDGRGGTAVGAGDAPGSAWSGLSWAVEVSGYVLAVVALPQLVRHPGVLAFALAVTGVAALGVALRRDRRVVAAVTGGVLLTCSSWLRLALWEVRTPEAYTLILAVVALAIGYRRQRQQPEGSSWSTYGPGLSLALLPSVLALWGDGHWLRPLLLGAGAVAVTVAGVRLRLQALLLLGAGAALVTAGHELAPTVVQVLGLLPRWLPLAVAGLLLLALGARYEQRLRDARRLRDSLRALR